MNTKDVTRAKKANNRRVTATGRLRWKQSHDSQPEEATGEGTACEESSPRSSAHVLKQRCCYSCCRWSP